MTISQARAIAFDILRRVQSEGAYASDLLHSELDASKVKPEDAALATEVTFGVLRWQRLLDFLLERHLKKPVAKLDLPVALALRLGLYQLRFLERIPPHAAVNESVELVKRARKASAASLVNAVLRRAATDKTVPGLMPGLEELPNSGQGIVGGGQQPARSASAAGPVLEGRRRRLPAAERLAILYSHSTWLVERWLARFGEKRTLALLEANNRPPRSSCTLHDPEQRDQIMANLAKSSLSVAPGALLSSAFSVTGGSVTGTDAFRRGAISIQDEASQLIPLLLGVRPGDRVLDLCAAPGGKTSPLARAAGETGMVTAADRHAHRLRAMRAQFDRLHIASRSHSPGEARRSVGEFRVAIIELDATQPLPFGSPFDRILVDAPCSGTGTLARHPEIRWRLQPEQLAQFHRLQVEILRSALDALAPNGRLVYSTCSLEPEENEDVICAILARSRGNPPGDGGKLGFDLRDKDRNSKKGFSRAMSASYGEPPIAPRLVPQNRLVHEIAPHLARKVDGAFLFDASGYFRTVPGTHPTDGFFAAALEKLKV